MNYLQFNFDVESTDQKDRLVALLSEKGFEGFEEDAGSLHAFIPARDFKEKEFSEVIDLFKTISYTRSVIENINWNSRWEKAFTPVLIDDFVSVRASFHQPVTNVLHDIIITPKMSFGTGHHATTHLVIQQMRTLDFNGRSVLDFGTGTGVLAILAEKLGAGKVMAIDYDEWSITNARENIIQNKVNNIDVVQLDTVPATGCFDIILANINLNVILGSMAAIAQVANRGAHLLLSGFLEEDALTIVETAQNAGFRHVSTVQRGDWVVVEIKKPGTE